LSTAESDSRQSHIQRSINELRKMAPPQVRLNEKPSSDGFMDPLPEKKDSSDAPPIVTIDRPRTQRCYMTAAQRRQRKRVHIACCLSMIVILLLLLGLGTSLLVYRMKHRESWASWCGTSDGDRVPEHVHVDHENQLIHVRPDQHAPQAMDVLHEYNRGMIAFKNSTSNTCYIDRLEETFAEGYSRWLDFEDNEHKQNHTLRVVPEPVQIEVVKRFAGVHIWEHCGQETVEYYWAIEVTITEIKPGDKYIVV